MTDTSKEVDALDERIQFETDAEEVFDKDNDDSHSFKKRSGGFTQTERKHLTGDEAREWSEKMSTPFSGLQHGSPLVVDEPEVDNVFKPERVESKTAGDSPSGANGCDCSHSDEVHAPAELHGTDGLRAGLKEVAKGSKPDRFWVQAVDNILRDYGKISKRRCH